MIEKKQTELNIILNSNGTSGEAVGEGKGKGGEVEELMKEGESVFNFADYINEQKDDGGEGGGLFD